MEENIQNTHLSVYFSALYLFTSVDSSYKFKGHFLKMSYFLLTEPEISTSEALAYISVVEMYESQYICDPGPQN